ncbi:argininosuccinate lyase [candidate division KSB1 bacterium]|nr:argininosuccinate lyase [candidate division KSB1 bacterium]
MADKQKIWGGRFEISTDELMEQFGRSISFDQKLFHADIAVNMAWAQALAEIGVYSSEEADRVVEELDQIRKDFENGKLIFSPADEDIHSANERWLTERLGDVGARIHTGRSRNDQVATDVRIWIRENLAELSIALRDLQHSIISLAEKHGQTVMAGQTHLRQAQPVSLGHYLLSFFFQLQRDYERLLHALMDNDKMPLGSGALAGSAFPVDRFALAKRLNFEEPTENSIDATSDRDNITQVIYVCAQIMLHLSRLAEDWIIWSSESCLYIKIHQKFATGSSMMPQKKNPDSLELVRGKTARIVGHLVTLMTLMKGIPTAYVRDLQEDKEPLFDSLEQTILSVRIINGVISTCKVDAKKLLDSLDPALYSTDLADYLVKKNIPFRKAHQIVGRMVQYCEKQNIPLKDLSIEKMQEFSPLFQKDVLSLFTPLAALDKRNLYGGTGPVSLSKQINIAKKILNG